jgi:hypothetical protein
VDASRRPARLACGAALLFYPQMRICDSCWDNDSILFKLDCDVCTKSFRHCADCYQMYWPFLGPDRCRVCCTIATHKKRAKLNAVVNSEYIKALPLDLVKCLLRPMVAEPPDILLKPRRVNEFNRYRPFCIDCGRSVYPLQMANFECQGCGGIFVTCGCKPTSGTTCLWCRSALCSP